VSKAAKRYAAIVRRWGSSTNAPAAQKAYADILLERSDMDGAFKEYQYLVKFYAGQFDYDEVLSKQMKIANFMMTTPRGKFLFYPGFMAPERALPFYEQILVNGPTWKSAPEARFNVGVINEEIGNLDDAILAYDSVMNKFRGHRLAPDAAFRKAVCLMSLSEKSPRDERSLRDALSAMSSFAVTYPTNESSEVAAGHLGVMKEQLAQMYFSRAQFYETVNKNEKAAIIAYTEFVRQFPSSKNAISAQERIDKLKSKQGASE